LPTCARAVSVARMAKKPKAAEPPGPRKHRGVRFSDDEWSELERAAAREALPSASTFIRQAALRAARGELARPRGT